ncbi:hypothetical protein pah_c004o241 [Parachlamydia acanthamoebae str. Hall's coccus]|jgi:outer membrane protein|nr:hypothetical protein pah_c004o241 [Parachlamydia acanthamoebae str. Hall's coccus]
MAMRIVIFLIAICLPLLELSAFDLKCGWEPEVRAAAFYPSSKKFRKIYHEWDADYQIEISKSICYGFSGWVNGSWLTERGRSKGDIKNSSRISIVPISFGAKYSYQFASCWKAYAGVGACYTFLRMKDHSPFVDNHLHKQSWGGVAKTGIQFYWKCLFFDLFADYLYQPFHFSNTSKVKRDNVNVGGYKLGLGIGFRL